MKQPGFANPFRRVTILADHRPPKKKPTTWRSLSFRRAVASLPCVATGVEGSTQAAHVDMGKGMALKTSDATCFAASVQYHAHIGSTGNMGREKKRATEDELNRKTILELCKRGMLVVNPELDVETLRELIESESLVVRNG